MTHYETLQVHPKATGEVIRASYMALIKANHPDLAKSLKDGIKATAKCSGLNDAYAILKDPAKRRAYDASLEAEKRVKVKSRQQGTREPVNGTPYRVPYQDSRIDAGVILREELESFARSAADRLMDQIFRGAR